MELSVGCYVGLKWQGGQRDEGILVLANTWRWKSQREPASSSALRQLSLENAT